MSEVEKRQRAALEGQGGGRTGQEGWPTPPYRASWSTALGASYHKEQQYIWFRGSLVYVIGCLLS